MEKTTNTTDVEKTADMEWTSCELDEIYQEGSVTCLTEFNLCLRCSGGIWELVDSESSPDTLQDKAGK